MSADLSVIVISHNHEKFLEKCFCSILEHGSGLNLEIILVDNVNSPGLKQQVHSRFPDIKIIANTSPKGFAANCNLGFKNSTGRHVLFFNPDAEIIKGRLKDLVEEIENTPDTGALCAHLLNPDLSRQPSVRRFPTLKAIFIRGFKLEKLFPNKQYLMANFDYTRKSEIDWGLGAFLMLSRDRYREINMMDEGFFMYYEDVDLCFRLKLAGYRNFFVPGIEVIHDYQRDSAKSLFSHLKFQHIKSVLYFFWKHKFTARPQSN